MKKPAREWEIDPIQAPWVLKIFEWFLGRGTPGNAPMMFKAIARRLNREGAPPSPKSRYGRWSRGAVKVLLENRRYLGD